MKNYTKYTRNSGLREHDFEQEAPTYDGVAGLIVVLMVIALWSIL